MQHKFYAHFIVLCLLTTNALAGQTTRVSVASNGAQALSGGNLPRISADGRIVAFISRAPNLVPGDTNGGDDFFVHDRLTKKTTRVSVSSSGAQGTPDIGYNFRVDTPSLSADGRYVAFTSNSNNLVAGDNGFEDVFIHDRVTRQTRSIAIDATGTPGFGDNTPSISADGRYVAFVSLRQYVPQETGNDSYDVYVFDRVTRKMQLISVSSSGIKGNQHSSGGTSISADGRYVAFISAANNLVVGDTTTYPGDLFVHDRLTHKTTRVNVSSSGAQANYGVDEAFSVSADGRYVAFSSGASNLVAGDTNGRVDVFIHDQVTHQTTRVSVGINGTQSDSDSGYPSITPDGRYVAFTSRANNLIVGDTKNYSPDIFVYDRLTKKTTLSSVDSNGVKGYGSDGLPSISADGRTIAFPSDGKLVADDSNNAVDVYVRDSKLDTVHHADLKITTTTKPVSLKLNSNGAFTYTVTNNGPDAVNNVNVLHVITGGGTAASLIPSQGTCSLSAIETVCALGKLLVGKSLMIQAVVKATGNPLNQQITVSGEPVDTVSSNNSISVSTAVVP